jgi:nucleoside permease NupC
MLISDFISVIKIEGIGYVLLPIGWNFGIQGSEVYQAIQILHPPLS